MRKSQEQIGSFQIHTTESGADYNETAKKLKKQNVFILVISILLAFCLWLYVMSVDSPTWEKTFSAIPITVSQNNNNLYVYSGGNTAVSVVLQGKKSEVNKLSPSDITAYVDIADIGSAGRYTLPVVIVLPEDLEIAGRTDDTVSLYLDTRTTVTVPVEVKLVDFIVEDGYELGEVSKTVQEVEVTGPLSVLQTVNKAQVKISLGSESIKNTISYSGTLEPVDEAGNVIENSFVKLGQNDVFVNIPVYRRKTVPLKVGYKYGYYNSENVEITIVPSTVEIRGDAAAIDAVTEIELPAIDEKKVLNDSTITRQITYPAGVSAVGGVTSANIQIKHIGTDITEMVVDRVSINNPQNLDCELVDPTVNILLRGDKESLYKVTPSDIEGIINLSYFGNASGTVAAAVIIVISDEFSDTVYEIGEYTAFVKIGN